MEAFADLEDSARALEAPPLIGLQRFIIPNLHYWLILNVLVELFVFDGARRVKVVEIRSGGIMCVLSKGIIMLVSISFHGFRRRRDKMEDEIAFLGNVIVLLTMCSFAFLGRLSAGEESIKEFEEEGQDDIHLCFRPDPLEKMLRKKRKVALILFFPRLIMGVVVTWLTCNDGETYFYYPVALGVFDLLVCSAHSVQAYGVPMDPLLFFSHSYLLHSGIVAMLTLQAVATTLTSYDNGLLQLYNMGATCADIKAIDSGETKYCPSPRNISWAVLEHEQANKCTGEQMSLSGKDKEKCFFICKDTKRMYSTHHSKFHPVFQGGPFVYLVDLHRNSSGDTIVFRLRTKFGGKRAEQAVKKYKDKNFLRETLKDSTLFSGI